MAQFQADIQGHRGLASRLGRKNSGIHAHIRSWEGEIRVSMQHNPADGCDYASIHVGPHNNATNLLYYGKVADLAKGTEHLILQAAQKALQKECDR
jgi:hypothetical protein